jgi:opacity protein-like surface antigen
MHQRTIAVLGSLAMASLYATSAIAQSTDGALQLGLGTDVFTYSSGSQTVEVPVIGEQESETSSFGWGFGPRNGINLEGGYGLGDSLVLGGFMALGGRSESMKPTRNNENTDSEFTFGLAPKLDYMFLPTSRFRPFLGGAVGLTHQSFKQETYDAQSGVTRINTKVSLTGLLLMARVGVRCFLTPGFSLDPALTFGLVPTASGSAQAGATSLDASASQFSIGLSLAASGWLGL